MVWKYLVLVFFMCLAASLRPISHEVLGSSPSFIRQIVTDPANDWFLIQTGTKNYSIVIPNTKSIFYLQPENDLTNCMIERKLSNSTIKTVFPSPDIEAVSYVSDGKTLNATLWLSDIFMEPPVNASDWLSPQSNDIFLYNVRYGMSIDVKSAYDIEQEADYSSVIEWSPYNNNSSGTKTIWNWTALERFSNKETKILHNETSHTGFFDKGKKYIELSLDLDGIHSPEEYNILFYTVDSFVNRHGRMCSLADISNR